MIFFIKIVVLHLVLDIEVLPTVNLIGRKKKSKTNLKVNDTYIPNNTHVPTYCYMRNISYIITEYYLKCFVTGE